MQEFDFIRPESLEEACNFLVKYKGKAKVVAGGTDLMIDLRKNKYPSSLDFIIDISHLDELNYITEKDKLLHVGSVTTHTQLEKSEVLKKYAGILSRAAKEVGSPQVRNRGTIGGNIVTASPAADTIPVLLVLNACLLIRRGLEKREVPVADFFKGANQVVLQEDELVSEIYFEKLPPGTRGSFIKLARRKAAAKSRLNIAVLGLQNEYREIVDIRIAPGSLTPIPTRFKLAENVLMGRVPDLKLVKKTGEKVAEEMIEKSGYRWSTDYKKPVIKAMVVRALNDVLEVG